MSSTPATLAEAARAVCDRWDSPAWKWGDGPTADLIAALRAAIAAAESPAQQVGGAVEPVANGEKQRAYEHGFVVASRILGAEIEQLRAALVASPPPAVPQPLTDAQIIELRQKHRHEAPLVAWGETLAFARAIERAYGIGAALTAKQGEGA